MLYLYKMKLYVRLILFPFLLFYIAGVYIRNWLFGVGLLKEFVFQTPVINIGNLSMGGTGKTPHVEYVTQLLLQHYKTIAILSRGYKRKTKGFFIVEKHHSHFDVGDEPCQIRSKFPSENVIVAVAENRKKGLSELLNIYPEIDAVILDDAFQHRYVKPGLNILLSDYYKPFWKDYILPFGNLREPQKSKKRADIIVITKSPIVVSPIIKRDIIAKANISENQFLCFSKIAYKPWCPLTICDGDTVKTHYTTIFLFTGIANPYPLELYLKQFCLDIVTIEFPDHHTYTEADILKIRRNFENYLSSNKVLITTEKDAVRLKGTELINLLEGLTVFYIPINIEFHKKEKEIFNNLILNYVRQN
jgi:tetraacyldisaccharide 4'-kinase